MSVICTRSFFLLTLFYTQVNRKHDFIYIIFLLITVSSEYGHNFNMIIMFLCFRRSTYVIIYIVVTSYTTCDVTRARERMM